jgi:hypothetical protein
VGISAILIQVDKNGKEYVVEYGSRNLPDAEHHFSITEKECLAVLWGVKH